MLATSVTGSVKRPEASPTFSMVTEPSTTSPGTMSEAPMMAALSALLTWLMLPALTVFFGLADAEREQRPGSS